MAPFSNTTELDSSSLSLSMTHQPTKPARSNSYDSSHDAIPDMIMSASLQSFVESDNDSLSSSMHRAQSSMLAAASPTSPRSIFKTYWSSPSKNICNKDDQDELLARLSTLQLPMDEDNNNAKVVHERPITSSAAKASLDDASIDYQSPPTHSPNTRARRQILPTPPPMTAVSSSLIMPRRPQLTQQQERALRQWSSTTALIRRMPNQSCLRKTRYSCSAIVASEATVVGRGGKLHQSMRNNGCNDLSGGGRPRQRPRAVSDVTDLKKSVSFYSQVSVFEFAPEQRRSQKGWSKYFA